MPVTIKTGTLQFFNSPSCVCGATVGGLLTAIPTDMKKGSWCREKHIFSKCCYFMLAVTNYPKLTGSQG
jgi:hypothetical protein